MDRQIDGGIDSMDRYMNGEWMDGQIDREMGGWMGQRMDGWMDGWRMDRWTDELRD